MKIDNIIIDIDGTITDGRINYCSCGCEFKSFNVKDGIAINTLIRSGISFYAITGRKSVINVKRLSELGVTHIFENVSDKVKLLESLSIDFTKTLYVGDDINDIEAMEICKYSACPADASKDVLKIADFVSSHKASDACFRDIAEQFFDIYELYKINKGVKQ